MKKIITLSLSLFGTFTFAQTFPLGQPKGYTMEITSKLNEFITPKQNNQLLEQNEMTRRANSGDKVVNFGTKIPCNISIPEAASKIKLENGDQLSSFEIKSIDALSLNIQFSEFNLANGTTLYLYAKDKSSFIGAYTSLNNNKNNQLGTDILKSNDIIVELYEPKNSIGKSQLRISNVIHGFADFDLTWKALGSSGDCNYDVNCPIGAGWENQRNGTIMLVNGGGFCTAALVNNTSGTLIPYVLSANHCGTDVAMWTFRFRWESPVGGTFCATPGNSVNGPQNLNVNGAILRANSAGSDFSLCEMNTAPNPAWNIFYNGWDNSGVIPPSATGVHHPAGDIKKISFENNPLVSASFGSSIPNGCWRIPFWDNGVTEPGSSGSPLFDQNKRIIGQLYGGASACGVADLSDEYGKFSVSWTGGGTNSTRLSNWLDPGNTGATAIDGIAGDASSPVLDGSLAGVTGASGFFCGNTVTPSFTILNNGTTTLTTATFSYGYDGLTNLTYTFNGSIAQYGNAVVTLPSQTLTGGNHTFNIIMNTVNGSADEVSTNNNVNSTFTTISNPTTRKVVFNTDCYGTESTWTIVQNGNIVASGGPYADEANGNQLISNICLSDTCFTFKIYDSYGDGFVSTPSCMTSGSASVQTLTNTVLVAVLATEGAFGDSISKNYCPVASGVNLSEIDNIINFEIAPNPTSGTAQITFPLNGTKTIDIQDATGKTIKSIQTENTSVLLDLSNEKAGIYFIAVQSEIGRQTKRLVLTK